MITKIDFANKTHITYIIILIIILFGIIYIWQNFKSNKHIDGFTQYDVNSDDAVTLFALDNVLIGNENLTLPQKLESLYYKITDGKTMDTRLTTALTAMSTDIATYKTELSNSMSINISNITGIVNTNKITLQNNIDANIPPLTIIAYYGISAPTGWQICDGTQLKAMDSNDVYYKVGTGNSIELKTPDLRGRSILGANLAGQNNNTSFTTSLIGNRGGAERHNLSREELPTHWHYYLVDSEGGFDWGHGNGNYDVPIYKGSNSVWRVTTGDIPYSKNTDADSDQPHNNMHPVYVLNYIIKQPKLGGKSNSISLQEAPSTSTISFLK